MTKDGVLVHRRTIRSLNPDLVRGPDGAWLAAKGAADPHADARRAAGATTSAASIRPSALREAVSRAARPPTASAFRRWPSCFAARQGQRQAGAPQSSRPRSRRRAAARRRRPGDVRAARGRRADPQRRASSSARPLQSFDWRTLVGGEEARAGASHRPASRSRRRNNDTVQRGVCGRPSPWHARARPGRTTTARCRGSCRRPAAGRGRCSGATSRRSALAEARGLGLKVLPWTVNDPADMARLIDWQRRRPHHRLPGSPAQGDGGARNAAALTPRRWRRCADDGRRPGARRSGVTCRR